MIKGLDDEDGDRLRVAFGGGGRVWVGSYRKRRDKQRNGHQSVTACSDYVHYSMMYEFNLKALSNKKELKRGFPPRNKVVKGPLFKMLFFPRPCNGTINYATPLAAVSRGSLFGHFSVKWVDGEKNRDQCIRTPGENCPAAKSKSLPDEAAEIPTRNLGTKSPEVFWDFV